MNLVQEVKKRYPHLDEQDVKAIVDKAKSYYYAYRYPALNNIDIYDEYRIEGFQAEQWVLAACDELIERIGISSVTSYRENGIQIDFGNSAQLSSSLINQVRPVVGVIEPASTYKPSTIIPHRCCGGKRNV